MSGLAGIDTTDLLDMADPRFLADPYATTARLSEQGAVVPARFVEGSTVWLVLRDAEVRAVLKDPRFVVDPASVPGGRSADLRRDGLRAIGLTDDLIPYLTESMLERDPPDHTRLRRLVSRAFTVRRVLDLRPRVEELTGVFLDRLSGYAEDGTVDLIEHFAYPLPVAVVCELVGVPEEDWRRWLTWSHDLVSLEPEAMCAALRGMVDNIRTLAGRRRAVPADDLLDALTRVQDSGGDRLSATELYTTVLSLVVAGHETTAHLIGNGTVALLAHPDQLTSVCRDPGLLPAAVHEIQRWCGPVIMAKLRYAAADVDLGGARIAAGDPVVVMLSSANRDPRSFPRPDMFDITRWSTGQGEQHVGFGQGVHYCVGAALGRQEAEIALGRLFARYPDLALAVPESELEWVPRGMRKLTRLPVRLGQARR